MNSEGNKIVKITSTKERVGWWNWIWDRNGRQEEEEDREGHDGPIRWTSIGNRAEWKGQRSIEENSGISERNQAKRGTNSAASSYSQY